MLAALVFSGPALGQTRSDPLRTFLSLERRALAAETRRFSDAVRRLDGAISDLSGAARAAAEASGKSDSALADAADALSRATAAVEAASLDQRLALERLSILRRRVAELEREVAASRAGPADAVSGDWHLRIDPGAQEGDLHLNLEGTLLGGSYALEGGMSGSVRGTVVGDRVRFDRVDSKIGFSAVFYGRLLPDGVTVTGTWEATNLSNGGPTSGTWSAVKKNEPEEP